jgi:hypothetical protein
MVNQKIVLMLICRYLKKSPELTQLARIMHNGPAIWGGCVTRRKHRAESRFFSREVVTVQGGYGALFAVMVQFLMGSGAVAVQVESEPRVYPRLQNWLGALAQCRGTNYLGARKLSRYRILIVCRCALCPT